MFFNNTQAALHYIWSDITRKLRIVSICLNLIYILFAVYAIVIGSGFLYLNIAIIAVVSAYMTFDITTYPTRKNEDVKELRKRIRRINRWIMVVFKTLMLSVTLYGAYVIAEDTTVLSIVMIVLMVIAWIVQVVSAIIISYFEAQWVILRDSFKKDVECLKSSPQVAVAATVAASAIPLAAPIVAASAAVKAGKSFFGKAKRKREEKQKD